MKMSKRTFGATLVVGAALVLGGCVVDGGFEKPQLASGWATYTVGQSVGAWQVVSGSVEVVHSDVWQASDGHQSLDLTGSEEAGTISQPVLTTLGAHYEISFMLAGNPDGAPAVKELQVSWDGVQVGPTFAFDTTGRSRSDMGYVPEVVEVTATGDSAVLEFKSLTAPFFGPVIDDVRVTEVQ